MFSSRLPPDAAPNALTRRLEALRAEGASIVDLTESNPTRAGIEYPDDLLAGLGTTAALRYTPHPLGMRSAREAVAADHARRKAKVDPAHVVLTASTSEAYGWLFKLLCDPGDRVLVPRPSYPLFEHLTRLDAVDAVPYDLEYHGRWEVDFPSIERGLDARTRAILVVSPNNPTGSYLSRSEADRLLELCSAQGLALIADEVFSDYPLDARADRAMDLALQDRALAFTLGGLSKSVGLPQLKLGWMVVGGPPARRDAALGALELIADSYLSVSTPVQLAAPALLGRGHGVRERIRSRIRENLARLRALVARHPSCELLPAEGGWSGVVRVPDLQGEDALVMALLERERILVHPGYFFDFPRPAYIIVSLLPEPAIFAEAVARMLQVISG